ncbi:hypothetical protein OHB41_27350 [Streptomyces sp. NBC_01571]|uniref:hypothetical protein n=1 Tax=Streptomyces sp. NBC_01571 TaxID=2975883 RepID=UPI00225038E6|nr:hypothetical protein [Streptomyces sp. NBC_01571]MCX4576822.1 hypothetical protein [Streptomyces sp. NBC_01571]
MSTPPPLPLEGQQTATTGPHPAEPAPQRPAVGEPKDVAEGVPTVLSRPKRFPDVRGHQSSSNPTPEQPGIRIYAPPLYRSHDDRARWWKQHGDTPTAAYACPCGQIRTATGAQAVAALVTAYGAHKDTCTGTPAPLTERRTAT